MDMLTQLIIYYGFFFLVFIVIVIPVAWAIWWWILIPKDARQVAKAKQRRRPLNLLFSDEGFCEMVASKKPIPEVLENPDKSIGVLPSKAAIRDNSPIAKTDDGQLLYSLEEAQIAQKGNIKFHLLTDQEREALKQMNEKDFEIQQKLNEIATKRFYLRSVGVPVTLQYWPKAIAINAATLALASGKEIGGIKLNPLEIKAFFNRMWLTSRLKSFGDYKEMIGRRSVQGMMGKWEKLMPVIMIGLVIMGIIAMAIILAVMT